MNRDLFSIFHCSYAFIAKCFECPTPIWQSVKEELCSIQRCDVLCGRLAGNSLESHGLCVRFVDGYSVRSSVWAVTVVCETGLRKEGTRWENLVQRGLDSKALRQRAIWLERTANLGGMLQRGWIKIDCDLLEQRLSERWEPGKTFKEISLSS